VTAEVGEHVRAVPAKPIATSTAFQPLDSMAESTRTRLGGVFYLLTVAQALGLYADFTEPETPGIALDPWDFLGLIARRLGAVDLAPNDPIWSLLDWLSARPIGARAGHGFRPSADWRIDPAWLDSFRDDRRRWRWSMTGAEDRLVVAHPAGFPMVDIRAASPTPIDVRESLAPYRPHPPLRRSQVRPPLLRKSRVDRWIDRVAAYVEARLGIAVSGASPTRALRLVLRHDAEVFATGTSVDVELSLASLPIQVRMAGLDRDLGWFPAARRTIAFHFS
jgi:hypothetical protein